MNGNRYLGKLLLWVHLFVCCIWLFFFRMANEDPRFIPDWIGHIVTWSILAIQFTWGFTIGLNVGPSRKKRHLLWWSLLTIFLPLWFLGWLTFFIAFESLFLAMIYLMIFTLILACETFCGVLLGVQTYSLGSKED